MKRLLNWNSSDLMTATKLDKLQAIRASEGRVLLAEISLFRPVSMLEDVSDVELAAAFGADIILLNGFDVDAPNVPSIPVTNSSVIDDIKRLTGRLVGVNLEAIKQDFTSEDLGSLTTGRVASEENARKLLDMGADMILLTGNPSTGVTNETITEAIKRVRSAVGPQMVIAAGKMHAAGVEREAGENIINEATIKGFIEAGADIVLLPAPGAVPGITLESAVEMVRFVHQEGALSITAIATSQEGSDEDTIRRIALMCKMTGTDIHHIGDAGVGGLDPENIMAYSIAIRGKRHTFSRMARSVNR